MFSGSSYFSGNNLLGPQNFWTGFVGDPIILDKIFGALQKTKKKIMSPNISGQDLWASKLSDRIFGDPKLFG